MNRKITAKEKELIEKYYKVVQSFVHKRFSKQSLNVRDELISQGNLEILSRIEKYDPNLGGFSTFIYNVLNSNLTNYHQRNILGYVQTSLEKHMSDEQILKKKNRSKTFDESMLKYENDHLIWKLGGKNTKEPVKPKELSPFVVNYRLGVTEYNDEYISPYNVNYEEVYNKKRIRDVILTFDVVKQLFCKDVFFNGINPKKSSNRLNKEIEKIAKDLQSDFDGVDVMHRKSFLDMKIQKCDNILKKEFYKKVNLNIDAPLDRVKWEMQARSGAFYKDNIITEIKAELNL